MIACHKIIVLKSTVISVSLSTASCSLRAVYGNDEQRNGLHASDSVSSAAREIKFIFPDSEYGVWCC